jgi:hypothetical protein
VIRPLVAVAIGWPDRQAVATQTSGSSAAREAADHTESAVVVTLAPDEVARATHSALADPTSAQSRAHAALRSSTLGAAPPPAGFTNDQKRCPASRSVFVGAGLWPSTWIASG